MGSQSNQGQASRYDWNRFYDLMAVLVARPMIEIYHGLSAKTLNWFICLTPGAVFNLIVLFGLDVPLGAKIKMSWLFPPHGPVGYLVYVAFGGLSGFVLWGLWQAALHAQVSRRLTAVFQTSGLKNAIGKLPDFIFDKPIDEFTRKMRLTRANLPASQFVAAKDSLESALQIYIDEIKEDRERGTIDITYAGLAMPKEVTISNIKDIGSNRFLVGKTRGRDITADLNEIPHYLVGGESGGGKSTLLRQVITTLYLNNSSYRFYLIDLKGGLEFQLFENLPRVKVLPDTKRAFGNLATITDYLKSRMEIFKKASCKDITAYLQKTEEERKQFEAESREPGAISRIIVVIDEAAELFMAGDKAQATQAQRAKSLAIKIAAQGRAVGVHLIIATQRPDVRAVDGQIKANLPGVLAFQMPNHASSMTILDNTRASHLPKIPGRAIWKTGLEMVELQTPFMAVEEVTKILAPYRTTAVENSEEVPVEEE